MSYIYNAIDNCLLSEKRFALHTHRPAIVQLNTFNF